MNPNTKHIELAARLRHSMAQADRATHIDTQLNGVDFKVPAAVVSLHLLSQVLDALEGRDAR